MSGRMWKTLVGALAALFVATGARAQPPVWVVRDADSEMVIFGSVHVLPPGLDWKPPALSRAIAEADDIWFELPIDPASEAETARLAGQRGMLAADQSLFEMLKPNYAWAIQVPKDDTRIKAEVATVPSPAGTGSIKGTLVRPANAAGKLPAVLV
ncbi:MAG: TraB/GumN family protein, partial [Phenylobacterium sp.]